MRSKDPPAHQCAVPAGSHPFHGDHARLDVPVGPAEVDVQDVLVTNADHQAIAEEGVPRSLMPQPQAQAIQVFGAAASSAVVMDRS